MIYFDNAATTFPKPEKVYEALDKANRTISVNAGRGSYALAKQAVQLIQEAKNEIKKLAHADEVAEVVFTASATLACNQVLGGLEWNKEDVVYVSPYEHNAVMRVLHQLQKKYGFCIEELAIETESLEIDLKRVEYQFIRKNPNVVIMSHVSNVLGYILPIEEVAKLAESYQAMIIIDGAQALGIVNVDLKKLPIDFYIFAGHKTLYGPLGTGGFIYRTKKQLSPFLAGGTGTDSLCLEMDVSTPEGLEPGSYNVVSIAGLLAALQESGRSEWFVREQELTQYLIKELEKIGGVVLYKANDPDKQMGIVSFNITGYHASEVAMLLDEDYDIAVRAGYQCAPFIHKYLHSEEYLGVVRVSIGRFTTKMEIDSLLSAVSEIAEG